MPAKSAAEILMRRRWPSAIWLAWLLPLAFGASCSRATLGQYTFHTFDGYDVTSTDITEPMVIFVWSTKCKRCDSLRASAGDLTRRYPKVTFLAISRDDEEAWRAVLGHGTALMEVRDSTGTFSRDTAASDGSIFLIAPDHTVRWRGEWSSTDEAELERRIVALQGASP
jgi:hypothetical protein